jgi:hypothetical protein
MAGPDIAHLFPIRVVADACDDMSNSIDFREPETSFLMWRVNHLGVANLLNLKIGSPLRCVNWLAIQFPELTLDSEVNSNLRIAAGDFYEPTNFRT